MKVEYRKPNKKELLEYTKYRNDSISSMKILGLTTLIGGIIFLPIGLIVLVILIAEFTMRFLLGGLIHSPEDVRNMYVIEK